MKKLLLSVVFFLSVAVQVNAGNGDLIVDGNVGIGTPSPPTVSLDVNGTIRSRIGVFQLNDGVETGGGLFFYKAITGSGNSLEPALFAEGPSGKLYFMTGGNATTKMIIDQNGYVGIGTTTPNYTLSVEGDSWTKYGNWIGSDAKLKKNVLPLSDALSKVLKLEGKSYEWKEEYYKTKEKPGGVEVLKKRATPEGRHYGVIAQEIEKVLPELVKENADGTKAVAYTELIPLLIEAIKEQQKRIELLEKK